MERRFAGYLLKHHRKSKGIKRIWIANKVGISSSMLYYVEKDEKQLKLQNYINLCDALDVPLEYFIEGMVMTCVPKEATK